MRYLISLLIFILSCRGGCTAQSDSARINFTHDLYDFGVVYEADGSIPIIFNYINSGVKPLLINKILSNGFILKEWTKDSIFPGDTGEIVVSLNPFNISGHFNKYIRVFSNASNSPSDLKVKGKILYGSYSKTFKCHIGGLALKHSQFNFGYLYSGSEITRFIPVLNTSENILKIAIDSIPDYLSVIPRFDSLQPKENGMIEITYRSREINDWDFVIDKLKLSVFSRDTISDLITITSNIREDFRSLSAEEIESAPKVVMPERIFNFDTISKGDSIHYRFLLRNDGRRDLNIRAVKPTCGCTVALLEKNLIPPGDSVFINVRFNSIGYSGINKKGVTIITNDPENYKQLLWITGYVK